MLQVFVVMSVESGRQGVACLASELNLILDVSQVHLHADEACVLSSLHKGSVTARAQSHLFRQGLNLSHLGVTEPTPITKLFLNELCLSLPCSYVLWQALGLFTGGCTLTP